MQRWASPSRDHQFARSAGSLARRARPSGTARSDRRDSRRADRRRRAAPSTTASGPSSSSATSSAEIEPSRSSRCVSRTWAIWSRSAVRRLRRVRIGGVDRREPRLEQRDDVLEVVLVLVGALEELRGRRVRGGEVEDALVVAARALGPRELRAYSSASRARSSSSRPWSGRLASSASSARAQSSVRCVALVVRGEQLPDVAAVRVDRDHALEVHDLGGAVGEALRRTGARGARAGARRRAAEPRPSERVQWSRSAGQRWSRSSSRSQCCSASRATSGTALSAASRVEDRERVLGRGRAAPRAGARARARDGCAAGSLLRRS